MPSLMFAGEDVASLLPMLNFSRPLFTNAGNKLECLGCKPFQPSLMLVSKSLPE